MLLGIPGDNTYAYYQEANRAFYRLTVLPMLTRTAASLSAWLSGHYEDRLRLESDLDKVAGLAAERDQLWTRLGSAAFFTDEEKRQAVGIESLRRRMNQTLSAWTQCSSKRTQAIQKIR